MNAFEKRSVLALSSIMGLRMMGLFMVLPVFILYAEKLPGATPFLVGIALGIYGLSQALLQIPLGHLSDRIGRKPIILLGLLIFAAGSFVAALASNMTVLIIGRFIQGAGAIGSTSLAFIADLTREEHRGKSMALAGISLGLSFFIAMALGPFLNQWFTISQLFYFAVLFSFLAIVILFVFVPTPQLVHFRSDTTSEWGVFFKVLKMPQLIKLNIGIFLLHAIFTASFAVVPMSLHAYAPLGSNNPWSIYLISLSFAAIISLVGVGLAESKHQVRIYFLSSILILGLSELMFFIAPYYHVIFVPALMLFFISFSLLEAFLPSLVSREAPMTRKGTALGIYSSSQFMGIFIGGLSAGYLMGSVNLGSVYLFCLMLAFIWLGLAFKMRPPQYAITQIIRLQDEAAWEPIAEKLKLVPGIIEAAYVKEDGLAYLKIERATLTHPSFIELKNQSF